MHQRRNRCYDRISGLREALPAEEQAVPTHLKDAKNLPVSLPAYGPLRPLPEQRARVKALTQVWELRQQAQHLGALEQLDESQSQVSNSLNDLAAMYTQWCNEAPRDDLPDLCLAWAANSQLADQVAVRLLVDWYLGTLTPPMPVIADADRPTLRLFLEECDIWKVRSALSKAEAEVPDVGDPPQFPRCPRHPKVGPRNYCHSMPNALAAMAIDEHERRTWQLVHEDTIGPTLTPRFMLVIHMFSGRRRHGDFQAWAEHFCPTVPFTVHFLSVDTAVSGKMDILQTNVWLFLCEAARRGFVWGFLMGPPCESWSAARAVQLLDTNGTPLPGPRPLRDANQPWGLFGLTAKEIRQVTIGNILMLRGLILAILAVTTGTGILVEHPAAPPQSHLCSIWRTTILEHLLNSGNWFRKHTISQFLFGATCVKPTTFLGGNISFQHLDGWARHDMPMPRAPMIGKESTGRFRTFKAKEYTWQLNRALASTIMQRRVVLPETTAIDIWWQRLATEFAEASRCTTSNSIMPDYQR